MNLSDAQFLTILCLVPILCVAAADGEVHRLEIGYLTGAISELTLENDPSTLLDPAKYEAHKSLFVAQLQYLQEHLDQWKPGMLAALRDSFVDEPAAQRQLYRRIIAVAEAHDGINIQERYEIDQLASQLGLLGS